MHLRRRFSCFSRVAKSSFLHLAMLLAIGWTGPSAEAALAQEQQRPVDVAQPREDRAALAVGEPVEREIAGGQVHVYRVRLDPRQFLEALVEQQGVALLVALYAPDGTKLLTMRSPSAAK